MVRCTTRSLRVKQDAEGRPRDGAERALMGPRRGRRARRGGDFCARPRRLADHPEWNRDASRPRSSRSRRGRRAAARRRQRRRHDCTRRWLRRPATTPTTAPRPRTTKSKRAPALTLACFWPRPPGQPHRHGSSPAPSPTPGPATRPVRPGPRKRNRAKSLRAEQGVRRAPHDLKGLGLTLRSGNPSRNLIHVEGRGRGCDH